MIYSLRIVNNYFEKFWEKKWEIGKNGAIEVAPCARQEPVFGIYGPEPGGGGGGGSEVEVEIKTTH
jgi:hypothetical protein